MIAAVLQGLALGLMLSISVGPVILTILKQSINNGHKGGFAFIAGVSASDITIVVICNLFTRVLDDLLDYKTVIGIAGSVLLIALGVYVTFFKKIPVGEIGMQVNEIKTHHFIKISLSGYFMNLLNPSVLGFWLLTSTSLLVHSRNYRLIVFLSCLILEAALDVVKVLAAGKIRRRLTPHNIHIINRISGMVLIAFGVALVWSLLAYDY
jgi:threonine/homoserine/homoserine lactone efflux protein